MKNSLTVLLFTLALALQAQAATVILGWTASADPSANGYRLYQGTASSQYTTNYFVNGRTTVAYQINGLVDGTTYFFNITATSTNGVESDFANEVTFMPTPPVIVNQPLSATNRIGATQVFTVSATGATPLTWQWYKNGTAMVNGGNASGVTTDTLTLVSLTSADNGGYSAKVSSNGGSATSATAVLKIMPSPPVNLKVM